MLFCVDSFSALQEWDCVVNTFLFTFLSDISSEREVLKKKNDSFSQNTGNLLTSLMHCTSLAPACHPMISKGFVKNNELNSLITPVIIFTYIVPILQVGNYDRKAKTNIFKSGHLLWVGQFLGAQQEAGFPKRWAPYSAYWKSVGAVSAQGVLSWASKIRGHFWKFGSKWLAQVPIESWE